MAILQVRDIPDEMHKRLVELAEAEHRSLSQQVTFLLKLALEQTEPNKHRRSRALESIRVTMSESEKRKFSDPAKLVREDRDR